VEDETINRMFMKESLKFQYDLIEASDGIEALKMYESHKPDLILLDIDLPKLSGLEVLETLRKQNQSVPVIAVTAYINRKEVIMEAGADDILFKPYNTRDLLEKVAKFSSRNITDSLSV